MNVVEKNLLLKKRRWRVRTKVSGTAVRPRLSFKASGRHLYAQAIDDDSRRTLVFLSTLDKELRVELKGRHSEKAAVLGQKFAARSLAAGVDTVVFDRNGRRFHGVVKAFADAARAGGLKF